MLKYSIVVPVYNVENYIEECINSILAQSYENWELILVNDASRDGSGDICARFAATDGRITYVCNEVNLGVSAARNCGIEMASGDYVLFLDGDDMLSADALSELSKIGDGFDIINFCWKVFYADGYRVAVKNFPFRNNYAFGDKKEVYEVLLQSMNLGSVCTKAIKMSIINGVVAKIRFADGMAYYEDQLFVTQAYKFAKTGVFLEQYLYLYRKRKSSAINSFSAKRVEDFKRLMDSLKIFKAECFDGCSGALLLDKKAIQFINSEMTALVKNKSIQRKVESEYFNSILDLEPISSFDKPIFEERYLNRLLKTLRTGDIKKVKALIKLKETIFKIVGRRARIKNSAFYE